MKIIIATQDETKMVEIKQILSNLPIELVSSDGFDTKLEIRESSQSIRDCALGQARQVCDVTNEWVIADASGSCAEPSDGQSGGLTTDPGERQPQHECAVALVAPDGQEWVFTSQVPGYKVAGARGQALDKLKRFLIQGELFETSSKAFEIQPAHS